jgi:hypothetical protein
MHSLFRHTQPALDGLALTLSGLCLLHCLAVPVALGLSLLADERLHLWMLLVVLPTSLLAVSLGCRRHGQWRLAAWATAGLVLMTAAAGGGALQALPELGERLLTSAGSLLLAACHIRNYRACRGQHGSL